MDIAAAIIAGGKNTRMAGKNKAFIKINNTPLIHRTIDVLEGIFDEILLVTNSPEDFRMYRKDTCIIPDIIKDIGPLGGIHSALSHTTKEAVFIVACDMPYLHTGLIRRLMEEAKKYIKSSIIPYSERGLEPLHAIYSKSSLENLNPFLDKREFSIREFLKHCDCKYIKAQDDEMSSFYNINTQLDLKEIVHE